MLGAWAASRVWGRRRVCGSGGGAEAADLGEEAADVARVHRIRSSDLIVAILLGVRKLVELGLAEVVVLPLQLEAPADDGVLARLIAAYALMGALVRVRVRVRVSPGSISSGRALGSG